MKVEITYPFVSPKQLRTQQARAALAWPFSIAAYICPIINLAIGGKAWSVIVLWSIWIVWTIVLSPNLVEYNRISQSSKLLISSAILLVLISALLSPGWMLSVVPTVGFAGLAFLGLLFFTDIEKQKQNMMPMLWISFASIIALIVLIIFWPERAGWEWIVLGATAIAVPGACLLVLGREMSRELKKRFHTD